MVTVASDGDHSREWAIVFRNRAPLEFSRHAPYSRRQMLLGWHCMYYYSNSYAMNQFLASRGFVVLAVNYRSGIGWTRLPRGARLRRHRRATMIATWRSARRCSSPEDLRKQGVDVEQLIFPDEVHDFLLHRNWLAAYTASFDFLTRKLVHRNAAH